jgi:hypothetical protein
MGAFGGGASTGVTSATEAAAAGTGATEVGKEALLSAAQSNIDPAFLNSMSQGEVAGANVLNTGTGTTATALNPAAVPPAPPSPNTFGMSNLTNTQLATVGGGTALQSMMAADRDRYGVPAQETYNGPLSRFSYNPNTYTPQPYPVERYAEGGIAALASGDLGGNMNYPQSQINRAQYATPSQMPTSAQVMASGYEPKTNPYTGVESPIGMKAGGIAGLLKGRGDGMSDSIHATIADRQPARLADGEFVVPADVVSHLGNGSTDAGAKHLYSMMDKVRKARTGTKKQGRQIRAGGYIPA